MNDCTTTEFLRTSETLRDIEWNRSLDADTRLVIASERSRALLPHLFIEETYDFSRDDENSRVDAFDNFVQLAMKLSSKTDPKDVRLVVCKRDDEGDWFWYVENVFNAPFTAGQYINAVQARIARNQAQKEIDARKGLAN